MFSETFIRFNRTTKTPCSPCQEREKIKLDKISHGESCGSECINCQGWDRCDHSSTEKLARLDPIMWSVVIIDKKFDEVYDSTVYTGTDCAEKVITWLQEKKDILKKLINEKKEMMPDTIKKASSAFAKETNCYSCGDKFDEYIHDKRKKMDHDHITAEYRGAACNSCNLAMVEREQVPVYIHNFQGFDSHLILSSLKDQKKLSVIQSNTEQIKSMSLDIYTFIDSFSFQSSSLSQLAEKLAKHKKTNKEEFSLVKQTKFLTWSKKNDGSWDKYEASRYKYVTKKAAFPYNIATSISKLEEITSFPSFDNFKNDLLSKQISTQEYSTGRDAYKDLGCKNMREYFEWYCLLGICFSSFIGHVHIIYSYRPRMWKVSLLQLTTS